MKKFLCVFLALSMLSALLLIGCTPEENKTTGGGISIPTEPTEDPNSIYDAEVKKLKGL